MISEMNYVNKGRIQVYMLEYSLTKVKSEICFLNNCLTTEFQIGETLFESEINVLTSCTIRFRDVKSGWTPSQCHTCFRG